MPRYFIWLTAAKLLRQLLAVVRQIRQPSKRSVNPKRAVFVARPDVRLPEKVMRGDTINAVNYIRQKVVMPYPGALVDRRRQTCGLPERRHGLLILTEVEMGETSGRAGGGAPGHIALRAEADAKRRRPSR